MGQVVWLHGEPVTHYIRRQGSVDTELVADRFNWTPDEAEAELRRLETLGFVTRTAEERTWSTTQEAEVISEVLQI